MGFRISWPGFKSQLCTHLLGTLGKSLKLSETQLTRVWSRDSNNKTVRRIKLRKSHFNISLRKESALSQCWGCGQHQVNIYWIWAKCFAQCLAMESCRKWRAVSSLLFSASPHLKELILATVSVRVLTGNRWCIPDEESLMKEPFGGGRGRIKRTRRELLNIPELATTQRMPSPLNLSGQGGELLPEPWETAIVEGAGPEK